MNLKQAHKLRVGDIVKATSDCGYIAGEDRSRRHFKVVENDLSGVMPVKLDSFDGTGSWWARPRQIESRSPRVGEKVEVLCNKYQTMQKGYVGKVVRVTPRPVGPYIEVERQLHHAGTLGFTPEEVKRVKKVKVKDGAK